MRSWLLAAAAAASASHAHATDVAPDRCIQAAALEHGVDDRMLRAILKVESGLRPNAVNKNANGTVDVGIGQINSIHFREFAAYGVQPRHLMDACVGTYAAAWILRREINRGGNTWAGVARYHSASAYCNYRYSVLLFNQLVRDGVKPGPQEPLPPARPCGRVKVRPK